ncbi:MAG: CBS domain-containing protein [Elusimicrobia bacterium]|nr:CBS domain-containing protein [Elusimicrobiota bacterium]
MKEVTKIQELVYELRMRDVMRKDVISVSPDMQMGRLRELFKTKRISGTPVVDGGGLVGIVSIEDFIKWLSGGGGECRISEKMTRRVETFYDDEALVHALTKMERSGYGRFPIIDRQTGGMCGIVTKGNIIEGLLKKIEIDYHEEEVRKYRASHIFEDIRADKSTLICQYRIAGRKLTEAGETASGLKTTLKRLGFHPDIVRRSAIIAYEAETNVIIYAKEGKMIVKVEPAEIYMKVEDKGPGIPDVEKVLEPGFSTAPDWVRELGFGAGMGLPNIKKCSDRMVLNSTVGKGTCLEATVVIGPTR